MLSTSTADVITAMLTEPTGENILDSGGENDRHWQRNAGMTAEDFEAQPRVVADERYPDDEPEVSTFHWMNERLIFSRRFDEEYREWTRQRVDLPNFDNMRDFAAHFGNGDEDEEEIYNSYNYPSNLSQNIQFLVFQDWEAGDVYAVVQTHNGADVRGGYSTPRVFRVEKFYSRESALDMMMLDFS
jgi:hypothetical protein